MNLVKTVKRFCTETVSDPYGIGSSIQGRFLVFDDAKSSGESSRRKLFETPPSFVMYSTNCINYENETYIVGKPNYDYYKESLIRIKYSCIPSDQNFKIASILEILTNTVTSRVTYSHLEQTKNAVADSETSFAVSIFTAYLPELEDIIKGDILFSGSTYYRVKSDPWIDGAGFKNVEAILLDHPVETVVYTQISGYDPITESVTNEAVFNNTKIFNEDAYYCYEHNSERYTKIKPGDRSITFKPSVVPKTGDKIGGYKILSVDTLIDGSYSCHCRI